jgi:uncharacterized Fe-S radical SAM superfamily protein PflX
VEISEERLAEIFLNLQAKGAANINLVTPTHYTPEISRATLEMPGLWSNMSMKLMEIRCISA